MDLQQDHEGGAVIYGEPMRQPASRDYGTYCFVCRRVFGGPVRRSDEHVIPRWILKHTNLYQGRSLLPNATSIRYAQRTVPCCQECNAWLDKTLEKPVSSFLLHGGEAPTWTTLYLWLMKLFYGTRFLETGLVLDLRNGGKAFRDKSAVEHWGWMTSALMAGPEHVAWDCGPPGSLLVFPAGVPESPDSRWDFLVPSDGPSTMICVRVSGHAMIATFGDCGWVEEAFMDWAAPRFGATPLHPVQVKDLFMTCEALYSSADIWHRLECRYSGERLPGRLAVSIRSGATVVVGEPERDATAMRNQLLMDLFRATGQIEPDDDCFEAHPRDGLVLDTMTDVEGVRVVADCFNSGCPALLARIGVRVMHTCDDCGASNRG